MSKAPLRYVQIKITTETGGLTIARMAAESQDKYFGSLPFVAFVLPDCHKKVQAWVIQCSHACAITFLLF